jgi:hypothetical protein
MEKRHKTINQYLSTSLVITSFALFFNKFFSETRLAHPNLAVGLFSHNSSINNQE